MPSVSRLNIAEFGRVNDPAAFQLLKADDLGISKSYYNKLKLKAAKGEKLPDTIKSKFEKILNKNKRHSIKLNYNTRTRLKVPKSIISKHSGQRITKLTKKGKRVPASYVWIKFSLTHRNHHYNQSFVITNEQFKRINGILNRYIDAKVKKYEDSPVFIHGITFQNI